MANYPENYRYSNDHEWVNVEGGVATIGITDYAQGALGDVVYVDLPSVGTVFSSHEAFGSVESVKAVSELFTPVGGEVIEINESLNDTPETVNSDPHGEAWMIRIKMSNANETAELLDSTAYESYLETTA